MCETWFDIHYDWDLIVSSFATQYHLLSRDIAELPYDEFYRLLNGIMYETPLGHIISIRSEKDPKVIKDFSPEQKRIRREWSRFRSKQNAKPVDIELFQQALKSAFGV